MKTRKGKGAKEGVYLKIREATEKTRSKNAQPGSQKNQAQKRKCRNEKRKAKIKTFTLKSVGNLKRLH